MQFSSWRDYQQFGNSVLPVPGVWQQKQPFLLSYPTGKSAMICYGVTKSLEQEWKNIVDTPGTFFRFMVCQSEPQALLIYKDLIHRFETRFGARPGQDILHGTD